MACGSYRSSATFLISEIESSHRHFGLLRPCERHLCDDPNREDEEPAGREERLNRGPQRMDENRTTAPLFARNNFIYDDRNVC